MTPARLGPQLEDVLEHLPRKPAGRVSQRRSYLRRSELFKRTVAVFCSGPGGQRSGSKFDPLNHAATSNSR